MPSLQIIHLSLVSLWGGILLAEFVMEGFGFLKNELVVIASLHYWTDLFIELPVVLMVLATGAILTAQNWPPSALLLVKIAAGLLAIGFNLYCTGFVILRYRQIRNIPQVLRYRRHILFSIVGLPFGVIAAVLGMAKP